MTLNVLLTCAWGFVCGFLARDEVQIERFTKQHRNLVFWIMAGIYITSCALYGLWK